MVYWKLPVVSVYVNGITNNWWHDLRLLKGCFVFSKTDSVGNGIESLLCGSSQRTVNKQSQVHGEQKHCPDILPAMTQSRDELFIHNADCESPYIVCGGKNVCDFYVQCQGRCFWWRLFSAQIWCSHIFSYDSRMVNGDLWRSTSKEKKQQEFLRHSACSSSLLPPCWKNIPPSSL